MARAAEASCPRTCARRVTGGCPAAAWCSGSTCRGSRRLLRIDTNTALQQELKKQKGSIEGWAEENKVALASATLAGESLEVRGDLPGLRKLLDENLQNDEITEEGDALVVKLGRSAGPPKSSTAVCARRSRCCASASTAWACASR